MDILKSKSEVKERLSKEKIGAIHLLRLQGYGSIKYQFSHNNEIQLMKLSHCNLAISDEEGKIMFFDTRSLNKRIEEKGDLDQNIDKRNLLKKRLRALRE